MTTEHKLELSTEYSKSLYLRQIEFFRTRAQPFYQALKANEPENMKEICRCANMDGENGIQRELDIVVQDVQHFGDGTRAICSENGYNSYDGYDGYGTCARLQVMHKGNVLMFFFVVAN